MSINVYNIFHVNFNHSFSRRLILQPYPHRPIASLPATCRGPPKALGWRAGGWSFIILVVRRAHVGLGQHIAGGIHVFIHVFWQTSADCWLSHPDFFGDSS